MTHPIALRAFAVFWWLLHACAVTLPIVVLPQSSHISGDIPGVAFVSITPLAIMAVARWIITGRWRLGPRW